MSKSLPMKIRDKLPSTGVSWRDAFAGAIVGFLVSILISSAIVPAVVPALVKHDVPGFSPPDVQVSIGYEPTSYREGQNAIQYNNITWDDDYRVYSVTIENHGRTTIEQVLVQPWLPGCVRTYSLYSTKYGEEVRVENPYTMELSFNPQFTGQTYYCRKNIEIDHIPPNQGISVEFVMTDEFDRCDLLLEPSYMPFYYYSFEWDKLGAEIHTSYVDRTVLSDTPEESFQANLDNSTQIPADGSVYLYGVNSSNPGNALNQCMSMN